MEIYRPVFVMEEEEEVILLLNFIIFCSEVNDG
jgi:hypothetical protein